MGFACCCLKKVNLVAFRELFSVHMRKHTRLCRYGYLKPAEASDLELRGKWVQSRQSHTSSLIHPIRVVSHGDYRSYHTGTDYRQN